MGVTDIMNNIRILMLPVILIIGAEFLLIALYYFLYYKNTSPIEKNKHKATDAWSTLYRLYCICV